MDAINTLGNLVGYSVISNDGIAWVPERHYWTQAEAQDARDALATETPDFTFEVVRGGACMSADLCDRRNDELATA